MDDGRTARQVHLERTAVDAMYRRLDQALAEARDAQRRTLSVQVEGAQDLYVRDVEAERLARAIGERRAAERALCFGRIDAATGVVTYIGRIGLSDETGERLLVDWRADAARPFYAATAASPQGLRRRRHLRLEGRAVVGVSDELLDRRAPTDDDVVGDGPLADALGQARTGRMREAVSTLQSEQDAIVRSAHRGVTVVQGGPGTGKTIVALHRAAYVLYAFPHVADHGVLVYGPNRRFLDYIGDVLPSLGENDVELATATDLLTAVPNCTDAPAVAERKGRSDVAALLAAWVGRRRPHAVPLTVTIGHDALTLDAAAVDRARLAALQDVPAHNFARERFTEHVADDLVDLMERRAAEALDAIDDEVASILGIDPDRATAGDLRKLGFDDVPVAEGHPEFDRDAVRSSLLGDAALTTVVERVWPCLDPVAVLHEFLTDHGVVAKLWPRLPTEELEQLVRRNVSDLSAGDLPLLDEVRDLVVGPPERQFGHVVIDEAQELTEMEWRMLMRRCPARSMTVVGDLAQAGSATTVRSWEEALRPFVGDRYELHTLTVNYRTTAEILHESAPLLTEIAPGQQLSHSLRHGHAPRRASVPVAELADAVIDLVGREHDERPDELVGVVSSAEHAELLQLNLAGAAVVVAAPDVRGLEFDTVVLVDPAAIRAGRSAGVRDLYVAMTRATKRLLIVEPA